MLTILLAIYINEFYIFIITNKNQKAHFFVPVFMPNWKQIVEIFFIGKKYINVKLLLELYLHIMTYEKYIDL